MRERVALSLKQGCGRFGAARLGTMLIGAVIFVATLQVIVSEVALLDEWSEFDDGRLWSSPDSAAPQGSKATRRGESSLLRDGSLVQTKSFSL